MFQEQSEAGGNMNIFIFKVIWSLAVGLLIGLVIRGIGTCVIDRCTRPTTYCTDDENSGILNNSDVTVTIRPSRSSRRRLRLQRTRDARLAACQLTAHHRPAAAVCGLHSDTGSHDTGSHDIGSHDPACSLSSHLSATSSYGSNTVSCEPATSSNTGLLESTTSSNLGSRAPATSANTGSLDSPTSLNTGSCEPIVSSITGSCQPTTKCYASHIGSYVSSQNSTSPTSCSTPATPYEPDYSCSSSMFDFSIRREASQSCASDSGVDRCSLVSADTGSDEDIHLETLAEAQTAVNIDWNVLPDQCFGELMTRSASTTATRAVKVHAEGTGEEVTPKDVKICVANELVDQRLFSCTEQYGSYDVVDTSKIDCIDMKNESM